MVYTMAEIREIAKGLGLKTGQQSKAALIRAIQLAEGNFDCYGSASGECDQTECVWREMCFAHEE